jgi:vacuolar-type H+-ATPase subunit E/Vma4
VKLEKEMRTKMNILVSEGKRKSRQAILAAKEDMIWDAISNIRIRLSSLESSELSSYLLPLYDKASRFLGSDLKVYPVNEKDHEILKGKQGVNSPIGLTDDLPEPVKRYKGIDLLGGFIATSSDYSRIMNMSFAGILEKEEDRIREIIAKTLFGE